DGLDWFPEETTACAAFSFSGAPPGVSDALWGVLRLMGSPADSGNPMAAINEGIRGGTLSRLSMAYVEDRSGKRTRQIMRFSGVWNRDRVIHALTKGKGVTSLDLPPSGDEKVTLIVLDKEFAAAVVGSRDILLGGYGR